MITVKLSVRKLIEYAQRSGDIDNGFTDIYDRAKEGTIIHQLVQKNYDKFFRKEVLLKHTVTYRDFQFEVEGRADGIRVEGNHHLVDEIKSTTRDLDTLSYNSNIFHWAQVKCYGYFYAEQEQLDSLELRLTYFHVDTKKIKYITETFTREQLRLFYEELLDKYLIFSTMLADHLARRDGSIEEFSFPYANFRKGQRRFAVAVYNTIREKKTLLAEAPTGVGKTVSTLFPAIKSLGHSIDKIMYLTAKSTTKQTCRDQLITMMHKNLVIKAVTLTSKEKICLTGECRCNPIDCPFAKGHYDRVNEAIVDIFEKESLFLEEIITKYAKKHKVCPVEYQFDLADFSDVIIADYNYAFDPIVYLKRFFDDPTSRITLLVDESHNLISRGREMYTYSLYSTQITECIEKIESRHVRLAKDLTTVSEHILHDSSETVNTAFAPEFLDDFIVAMREMRKFLVRKKDDPDYDEILNLYFEFFRFLKISDYFDDSFRLLIYRNAENSADVEMKIKCLDTSHVFRRTWNTVHSAIFFSATLSPFHFYSELFGLEEPYRGRIESPFDPDRLKINIVPLSMRYKDRTKNRPAVIELIRHITRKRGNKIIFFPSYGFMHEIVEYIDFEIVVQNTALTEAERIVFLEQFTDTSDITAFCVLGGVFSEGIDLVGNRLNTVAILSVGLPKVTLENDLMMDYFNTTGKNGFQYAYVFPGMNKIAQAGGRVIRDKNDVGEIYLVDDRFLNLPYKNLLPAHWKNIRIYERRANGSNKKENTARKSDKKHLSE